MSEMQTGVVFPAGADGRRSTTATGRDVWADAVRGTDPALAERIAGERDWRKRYVEHVVDVTAAATRTTTGPVDVARAGLAALEERMVFERDGETRPVSEVVKAGGAALGTTTVVGENDHPGELVLPYRGERLRGDALLRQVDAWAAAGVVEPSCAAAVRAVVDHPDWLDLRDRSFALLGAAAELGPAEPLLAWGAHVAGVDLPRPRLQDQLVAAARAGSGRLDLPAQGDTATGADLLTQAPEVAQWLTGIGDGRPLTVGSYAYADGARHVQVAVASDAVVEHLLRTGLDVSYAELATPTDAYAVPADVVRDAHSRWRARGWRRPLQGVARGATRGALYAPSYPTTLHRDDGTEVGIADVLVPQQGPNYTLAKRVQRWRALVAQADGVVVSANVAPATSTRSVTKNRLLAAAYAGAGSFGVEVFAPVTSRVLMAALLVHDLRTGSRPLQHPDDLFAQQAAHGGLWRVGYSPRSVLGLAALRGLPGAVRPPRT
ncbi:MAG TPA: hypothetical protein VNU26_07600 [Mycobacteriales bacterium]|nr:hypothetical protein [Mycobacteriales bacterium]